MKSSYNNKYFYLVEVVLGASIIWLISSAINEKQFISWGLFAFLGTLERNMQLRLLLLKQRLLHTILATIITIITISIFGAGYTSFYVSLIIAMIVGNLFRYYPSGWKLLPATTAVLNFLAMYLSSQYSSGWASFMLISIRIFETILGVCIALSTQFIYIRYLKSK